MFHTNNFSFPNETWNLASSYYPGPDYVEWLGLSIYGPQFKNEKFNPDFQSLIDWPYQEICALDPRMPIMIAEWGTGEFPYQRGPTKSTWIEHGLELFRTTYPRIKAAVYWHERWENEDGFYTNLGVDSSVESLKAYRQGVANPYWLGSLSLRAVGNE
jgi:beta-mannanase